MNIVLRIILCCVLGSLLCFWFYFLYSGNFDRLHYDKGGVFYGAAVVMGGIPVTLAYFVSIMFNRTENARVAGGMIGFLMIGHAAYYGHWQGKHELECYARNGVRTKAVVTSSFYNKGARMYYGFRVNGDFYSSFNVGNRGNYAVDDSIDIIYNSKIPDMNMALETWANRTK